MVARADISTGTARLDKPFPRATSLSLDIETDPTRNQALVVLAISDGEDSYLYDLREQDPRMMQMWLKYDVYDREIVGHNLGFDLMHLHDNFLCGYPEKVYDTWLMEQILTAGLPTFDYTGLDDVLLRYCGATLDKTLQTSFRVDEELTEEQVAYATGDVIHLHKIKAMQEEKINDRKLGTIKRIELADLEIFAEMTRVGVYIDMDRMGPLLEQNRQTRDRLKKELQLELTPVIHWKRMEERKAQEEARAEWQARFDAESKRCEEFWTEFTSVLPLDQPGFEIPAEWITNKFTDMTIDKKDNKPKGMKRYVRDRMSSKHWRGENPIPKLEALDTSLINLNSSQQMLFVFAEKGLHPTDLDGRETTGKKTLEALLVDANEEQRDLIVKYLAYRKAEKIDTAFGDKLIERRDERGRVHGWYKQIGTQTGRPAVLQPNMNQMPNDPAFRSCFRAERGDVFIVADYQQMELRIVAQLSGDTNMKEAFKQGLDLHTYTASLMFNVPFDEVTSKQRKTAKTINFGILYGMGPKKLRGTLLAEGIDMSYQEARDAIKRWKQAYPQAAHQIERWGQEVLEVGYTSTPFGRKRFFKLPFEDDDQKYAAMRAGANHPIQGTNADITKVAMYGIHQKLQGRGEIILQVYDEIVVQCREPFAAWVQHLVTTMMVTAAEMVLTDVPAGVDSVISRSWNEDDSIR